MAFMTYLVRRGPTWHFRFRLPDDLRGKPVPDLWPDNLNRLVSKSRRVLKHELTESLRTSDNSAARARAGILISDSEMLVREARRFIAEGPARTVSDDVIDYLAERYARDLLLQDDALRSRGFGVDLSPLHRPGLQIPEDTAPPVPPVGFNENDLHLLSYAVDRASVDLRKAVAMRRPTEDIKRAVEGALEERGITLEHGAPERSSIELRFLSAAQRMIAQMQQRNAGEFIATPAVPLDPAAKHGPRLSETFEEWRTGRLIPGMKVPRQSTIAEAEYGMRRFRELHGDPRIGAITREEARAFRDALWKLPTRLPNDLERLPLPELLQRGDLSKYPRRSAGTLKKHITLISAVISKAGKAYDLKYKAGGWNNPFDDLKPEANDARQRLSFSEDDLSTIFSSEVYAEGKRARGRLDDASFWLPLLGLLTGARLSELAQLTLSDVKQDTTLNVLYFDFNSEGGKQLKTKTSARQVPLHSVLGQIGFGSYLADRRAAAGASAPLFADLSSGKRRGRPGDAWSRRFNRWRKSLGIVGGESRKDFHSFRHTFKDMCRAAGIMEEVHDALTGHSFKGVGRKYGSGVPLSAKVAAVEAISPPLPVQRLVQKNTDRVSEG